MSQRLFSKMSSPLGSGDGECEYIYALLNLHIYLNCVPKHCAGPQTTNIANNRDEPLFFALNWSHGRRKGGRKKVTGLQLQSSCCLRGGRGSRIIF